MRNRYFVLLAVAAGALAYPAQGPAARAGSLTGVLAGQGTAQTYALPGADILLCPAGTTADSGACLSAVTDSDGWFRVPDVPPGSYTLYTQSKSGTMIGGTVAVDGSGDVHLEIVSP
jgi:hypothetical protein